MNNVCNLKIIIKHDTEERWRDNNPVLRECEIATAINSHSIGYKVGDGIRKYSELPFVELQDALSNGVIYAQMHGRPITVSIDTGYEGIPSHMCVDIDKRALEEVLCGIS